MRMNMAFSLIAISALISSFAGCEQRHTEEEPDPAAVQAQHEGGQNTVIQGGGSSLGGAKRGAKDVANKIKAEQDRAIEEADRDSGTTPRHDEPDDE
jgi:hypothetical protein